MTELITTKPVCNCFVWFRKNTSWTSFRNLFSSSRNIAVYQTNDERNRDNQNIFILLEFPCSRRVFNSLFETFYVLHYKFSDFPCNYCASIFFPYRLMNNHKIYSIVNTSNLMLTRPQLHLWMCLSILFHQEFVRWIVNVMTDMFEHRY